MPQPAGACWDIFGRSSSCDASPTESSITDQIMIDRNLAPIVLFHGQSIDLGEFPELRRGRCRSDTVPRPHSDTVVVASAASHT